MKNIVKELFKIDKLLKELKTKEAQYLEAIGNSGTPQEALVRIEHDIDRLQKKLYAKDPYTKTRRFINWN